MSSEYYQVDSIQLGIRNRSLVLRDFPLHPPSSAPNEFSPFITGNLCLDSLLIAILHVCMLSLDDLGPGVDDMPRDADDHLRAAGKSNLDYSDTD